METININYLGDKFNELQSSGANDVLNDIRKEGFKTFNKNGIPTPRNEEWRFTSISDLFKKEYSLSGDNLKITALDIDGVRLPGYKNANELVFLNGSYIPGLSTIRSSEIECSILPLEEAAGGKYKDLINKHLGKSSLVVKDGIHALNTSFIYSGIFIHINKNQVLDKPVYIYHLSDARSNHTLAQPRSLIFVDESAKLQLAESFTTVGPMDSFTNGVMEVVVNTNAIVEYYKIQNDVVNASQVTTTHIRQIGKSYAHAVTISLNGGLIRSAFIWFVFIERKYAC